MPIKKSVVETRKKAFLEAMLKTFGNISASARAIGVDRTTPYVWAREDPAFAEKLNADIYEETYLDAIEAKLAKLAVQDENPTVLIFLAKTKGKKRGYIEKSETDLTSNGQTILVKLPDPE